MTSCVKVPGVFPKKNPQYIHRLLVLSFKGSLRTLERVYTQKKVI
jgi:hypothetical protein